VADTGFRLRLAPLGRSRSNTESIGNVIAMRGGSVVVQGAVVCFRVSVHADRRALAGDAEVGGMLGISGLAIVGVSKEVEHDGREEGEYEDGEGLGH
jgi:hypothetical protein